MVSQPLAAPSLMSSVLPIGTPGLSETEACARLKRDGPNRLPPPQHKTFAAAVLSVALQPMVLLLACTLLYALLGSVFDSVVLSLSIVAVAAISVYQELRTPPPLLLQQEGLRYPAVGRLPPRRIVEALVLRQAGDATRCTHQSMNLPTAVVGAMAVPDTGPQGARCCSSCR